MAGISDANNTPDNAKPPTWTFLTNHSHVLILLALEPDLLLRQVAERVGITERAVQKIVAELEAGGVLTRRKVGRRNRYRISESRSLRHPVEGHRRVRDLINMVRVDPDKS
ncbi:MAG: winged helix-turn-helix domain-containing protein [Planctomycetota bacterium]